jgi:hypothetical protein
VFVLGCEKEEEKANWLVALGVAREQVWFRDPTGYVLSFNCAVRRECRLFYALAHTG